MFKALWITKRDSDSPHFDFYPASDETHSQGTKPLYLTNDIASFEELFDPEQGSVIDIMQLEGFLPSDGSAERAEQLLPPDAPPSAAALWQVWQHKAAQLSSFPLWALESIELILRDLGELSMARLFAHFGEQVRLSGKNCGAWRDSFKAANISSEKRKLPEHSDCEPIDIDNLASLIEDNGACASLMPGYEVRHGQVEMLKRVAHALNTATHLLVEAGTGVGKSLAYLLPAAAWGQLNDLPVVVSTNTRNLQSQLVEKDLPLVQQVLKTLPQTSESPGELRAALLKGRSNYLCLRQLAILMEQGQFELDRPGQRLFAESIAWSIMTPDGDLDNFAAPRHADPLFLSKLASLGDECPGRGCRFFRRCFLQKARAKAATAHVVVANHALVFADMRNPGTALPPYAQVVFDEGHNLEEAATRHLSVEVSISRLNKMLRRLSRRRGKQASGMLEVLRNHLEKGAITADRDQAKQLKKHIREIRISITELQESTRELFKAAANILPEETDSIRFRCTITDDDPSTATTERTISRMRGFVAPPLEFSESDLATTRHEFKNHLANVASQLNDLAKTLRICSSDELALYGDQSVGFEGAANGLRDFGLDVDFVISATDPDYVFCAESVRRRTRGAREVEFMAAPLKVGGELAEHLYKEKSSVILCSATLRVGSSFNFINRRLGFDQVETDRIVNCVADSPFNYLEQCQVLAPAFLPEPNFNDGVTYIEQLAALMLDLCIRTQGRTLGLFTSYDMMNRVATQLEEPLQEQGIRLLTHGSSGTRDQITRLFRSGDPCVLLGTHSFWEGVDVAGEALSCVVMARLPFAAMGDPIFEARCEQIDTAGGSSFSELSLPQAVIKFRQGFGRLIRTRADRGIVVIADSRITRKGYGKTFQRGLPCPLLTVDERSNFINRINTFFSPTATT